MKNDNITFASTDRIDKVRDILDEVLAKILDWNTWALVTDESSLFDFPFDEIYKTEDEMFAKIKTEFGVDVSHIKNANLAEICDRIHAHRNSQ